MTEKPIIFSAPMVKALLEGRKSQTRRVLKPQPFPVGGPFYRPHPQTSPREWHSVSERGITVNIQTVPYAVGDCLWVREALERANGEAVGYPADGTWLPNTPWQWKRDKVPSIHMPRWASRITLRVTEVRVQRLQEITEEDALEEGIFKWFGIECFGYDKSGTPGPHCLDTARDTFAALWGRLHGPGSWEANPWVAAISFEKEPTP